MRAIFPDSKTHGSEEAAASIGVLICERGTNPPFAESSFIRKLSVLGSQRGMSIFAFAPWTWDARSNTVKGWMWNGSDNGWQSSPRVLPQVVYDRAWPASAVEKTKYRQALLRIKSAHKLIFLNGRLPNKGGVNDSLAEQPDLRHLIPPTAPYEGPASIVAWLGLHGHSAFLKPAAGSQGRRVIAITRSQDGLWTLTGRQSDNRPFAVYRLRESDALARLQRWIGRRAYLMQPLLALRGSAGEPFDLRVLMQKDRTGRWKLTGTAARCGLPHNVTSNLSGGGTATAARDILVPMFGAADANEKLEEVRKISFRLVEQLEETFGRFAEIGLDFGIDRTGKLWFLEANTKPGRAAMGSAGAHAAELAAERPLSYARSILLRQPGRVIHEFDHL